MRTVSLGRAFVYVFPCRGEDILKLGFSRDPLDRLQSLHVRYFDFFDLERAFLIEVDTVREARAIELALGRSMELHNAPEPLRISDRAGGRTEWYRGALDSMGDAANAFRQEGHILHSPMREWLRGRLIERGSLLFHWAQQVLDAIQLEMRGADQEAGDRIFAMPPTRLEWMLRNALDAYAAFGLEYAPFISREVGDWDRASAARFAAQRISRLPWLFQD